MTKRTNTSDNWRPPGWRVDETDVDVSDVIDLYEQYKKAGYFRSGSRLSKHGEAQADADEALIVAQNVARLRDSWNTPAFVWELAAQLTGVAFRVDPFWNPGATGLASLVVKLDGSGDQEDKQRASSGMAKNDAGFPLNWRGKLKKGKAAAAVNGPHSRVEDWLKSCQLYGQEEICAAFVPDCGDGWFSSIGLTASLVVRLSRVACSPPPGINASSPRGASACLIWIPPTFDETKLPEATRGVLKGKTFRVPLESRPRAGMRYAYVQPGNITKTVDFFGIT